VPVYNVASKFLLAAVAAVAPIVGVGKFVVHNALKPVGGVYANGRWPQFNTKVPFGYNLTNGGDGLFGFKQSEEQRIKSAGLRLGIKHSEETKQKMKIAHLGKNNHFYGKTHLDDSKAKISATKHLTIALWLTFGYTILRAWKRCCLHNRLNNWLSETQCNCL
jgi:hypothetical protein